MTGRSIYFAQCIAPNGMDMGAIKIGCSYGVGSRLSSISNQVPFACKRLATCPGEMFEESVLHAWLRHERIRGEFFHDGGETRRLVDLVAVTGKFPLAIDPMDLTRPLAWLQPSNVERFMDVHGLTLAEAAAFAGGKLRSYEIQIKAGVPSRRFVAALVVAALKKGHRVNWDSDFLAHAEANGETA